MAARTAEKRTPANGKPPGSIAMQARVIAEELDRIEYLKTRAEVKQAASEHDDEHPYARADGDGDVLSYQEYLKALAAFEKKLKDVTPPAAWRLAQKRLRQAAADQEAA